MARFGTVLTAMVTPFDGTGKLDLAAAQKLARHLVDHGNDGVVVAGTTGESATISYEEQRELLVAVREALPDHTVVAGAGSNDTVSAVRNTIAATEAGADGILAVTPYYNRPSQAGIEAHFRASAAETDRPVILYDIPARTGRKIEMATLIRLAEVDNIVAVKDAAGDVASSAALLAEVGDELEIYSGEDKLTLPLISVGAVGVIGVATHWVGREMSELFAAYADGRVDEARAINARLIPSYNYEAYDDAPNPVPSKVMMNLLGMSVGQCRSPMGPIPDDLEDRARAVMSGLERPIS